MLHKPQWSHPSQDIRHARQVWEEQDLDTDSGRLFVAVGRRAVTVIIIMMVTFFIFVLLVLLTIFIASSEVGVVQMAKYFTDRSLVVIFKEKKSLTSTYGEKQWCLILKKIFFSF